MMRRTYLPEPAKLATCKIRLSSWRISYIIYEDESESGKETLVINASISICRWQRTHAVPADIFIPIILINGG
jgi:hypothetical protein